MSSNKQTIIVQQTNQGCGGCLIALRDGFWGLVLLGMILAFAEQYGIWILPIAGFGLGLWGGVKVNNRIQGTSLTFKQTFDQINKSAEILEKSNCKWSKLKQNQQKTIIYVFGIAILGALGGLAIGTSS